MAIITTNNTKLSNVIISPTFIWCFLMPSIHLFSLLSNILCIIVFCSNTFIKKPIAIYFICLLISDSMTLLIGYIEMIDRESNMIDKSSLFCIFNEKIIHTITDFIYTFMGRFCLEWMLYKILWTRASTILLAILSIQRSRTFFSLSYHESRLCAFFACIFSIIIALTLTCLEWIGVQYDTVNNSKIYFEIFQLIIQKNSSKDFYSTYLSRNYNESINNYPCTSHLFNITSETNITNQSNCSSNEMEWEFYMLTRSLLSSRDSQIVETTSNLLTNLPLNNYNFSTNSILMENIQIAKTTDFIGRLFERRSCQITLKYSFWLRFYNFLHSVSFSWNRRTIAIFFGNALPSFIVVLANLLSIKVIYFSNSLKYLKQTTRQNRRKRRLQNDLHAFLVILIESFSIIMISWGIPIFLTMYHCRTLYVINITTCPKIKDYLALFLFIDLFNSSTNCLLYSLSGKLFRNKFLFILKTIFTCGRGTLWNIKQHSSHVSNQPLDRQPSNNPSINTINNNKNFAKQSVSKPESYRHLGRLSSSIRNNQSNKSNNSIKTTNKSINEHNRNVSDDGSLSMGKTSDDQHGGKSSLSETESDITKKSKDIQLRKNSQSIKSFLIDKVRLLGPTNSVSSKITSMNNPTRKLSIDKQTQNSKKKYFHSILSKRQTTTNLSLSSSSYTGSASHGSQLKHLVNNRHSSSKIIYNNTIGNLSITDNNIPENLTNYRFYYKPGPIGNTKNQRQFKRNNQEEFNDDETTTEESDESKNNSLNDSLPLRPVRNLTMNVRRYRSSFNTEQIEILEQTFSHTPYPDVTTRERLSQLLNIEENRIQIWFSNRRARTRKLPASYSSTAPGLNLTNDEENIIPSFLSSPVMDVKPFSMPDTIFDPTITSSPSPNYWPPTPPMPYGATNHSYPPMTGHYYSTYGSPTNTSIYPNYPLSYSPYPSFY